MTRNRFRIQHGARLALALGVSSLATLSCSFIVNDTSTKQCSVDADCTKLGAAFANTICQQNLCVASDPLSCRTIPQTNPTVKLTFTIGFAAKPTGSQGLFTVVACNPLDVNCDSPIAGPATEDPTDTSQSIELDVPYGFQGFLQITNDGVTVPSMEFLARPLQQDTAGWNLTIATPTTVALLGAATGTSVDIKNDGLFIMVARDCNRTPIAGVQTTINVTQGDNADAGVDSSIVAFYLDNTFPVKTLMATTAEGAAGFANVPPGSAVLNGTIQASGFQLQPTSAQSRAGWISYVEVQP